MSMTSLKNTRSSILEESELCQNAPFQASSGDLTEKLSLLLTSITTAVKKHLVFFLRKRELNLDSGLKQDSHGLTCRGSLADG